MAPAGVVPESADEARDPESADEAWEPESADVALVARVVDAVRDAFGSAVVGVWLHGSWVRGGLRPRSDLDLLAVLDRPTIRAERTPLIRALLAFSGRAAGGRSVELTVVVRDAVRPWVYPPPLELQYGDWWHQELEAGEEPWTSPSVDLAIVLAAALEANAPLGSSPALADVLDPVPPADVRRAVMDALPDLGADLEGDEANVLLTYARMWATLVTGRIVPKDEAAAWALGQLPAHARLPMALARDVYLGLADDDWSDRAAVEVCAGELLAAIAAQAVAAAHPGERGSSVPGS